LASVGASSFGDKITSVGSKLSLQSELGAKQDFLTQSVAVHAVDRYWKDYDFFESSALPDELESRGFEEDLDIAKMA
jgi:hypothetical protein